MSEPVIEVKHLSKTFGTNQVLKDIDFTVSQGDVISVIGPSGSGKSTMLRCINLLETPTGGDILYHGKSVTGKARQRFTLPFQCRNGVSVVQSFHKYVGSCKLHDRSDEGTEKEQGRGTKKRR